VVIAPGQGRGDDIDPKKTTVAESSASITGMSDAEIRDAITDGRHRMADFG